MWKWCLIAGLAGLAGTGLGCNQEPSTIRSRQDAALKDPWNYSPFQDKTSGDISGGGLMDLKSDAMRKDANSVLSP